MPLFRRGHIALAVIAVVTASCSELARRMDGSWGVVEVIETPPPIPVETTPVPIGGQLVVSAPEPVFLEAAPPPPRHVVRVTAEPANARTLSTIQSLEVEVEVSGGPAGVRELAAVFVSPQGLVWERQVAQVEVRPGEVQRARFSLPVAGTFIEEQQLSGRWAISSFDEGTALGAAEVLVEGVAP